MIKAGKDAVIVDLRLPRDYKQGHIPGAIKLPNGQWRKPVDLSRDNINGVYCYSQTCHLAAQVAIELLAQGYPVMEMEGGVAGWQAAGYEIEVGSDIRAA
ncbi:MAG TPA: rhodanese-like domain-containing protein [Gammaproteobacteria bacterium]|nr:rhodanese-like domain-containing protein [Gammaproteobacteria bacterium]